MMCDVTSATIRVKNVKEVFDGTTTKRLWQCVDCKAWVKEDDLCPEVVGGITVIMCNVCNDFGVK